MADEKPMVDTMAESPCISPGADKIPEANCTIAPQQPSSAWTHQKDITMLDLPVEQEAVRHGNFLDSMLCEQSSSIEL